MQGKKIEVQSYSGYRGEEMPRALFIEGERIEVTEIERMWIEEDEEGRVRKRFFRIKVGGEGPYTIYFDEEEGVWFLRG